MACCRGFVSAPLPGARPLEPTPYDTPPMPGILQPPYLFFHAMTSMRRSGRGGLPPPTPPAGPGATSPPSSHTQPVPSHMAGARGLQGFMTYGEPPPHFCPLHPGAARYGRTCTTGTGQAGRLRGRRWSYQGGPRRRSRLECSRLRRTGGRTRRGRAYRVVSVLLVHRWWAAVVAAAKVVALGIARRVDCRRCRVERRRLVVAVVRWRMESRPWRGHQLGLPRGVRRPHRLAWAGAGTSATFRGW